MNLRIVRLISSLLLFAAALPAQRSAGFQGTITGRVIDEFNSAPLEYANIMLYQTGDSTYVTGTTTDRQGIFILADLNPGRYYLQASFIGYRTVTIDQLRLGRNATRIDLKQLALPRTVLETAGFQVLADRPVVEYRIDKKVVNVAEEYSTMSGTAVDVLESVPSINVDIEGNVRLRGSSSFTVLIDGRPTVLDANDALQQIPATTIENIEIITNPSARYDPEGISGIINVITKKRRLEGISGMLNSNAGLDDKYGANFLLGYRNGFGSVTLGANYDLRSHPGTSVTENRTFYNDTTSTLLAEGTSDRRRRRLGVNGEVELFLGPRDNLNLGFHVGDFTMKHSSEQDYSESINPGPEPNEYLNTSTSRRSGAMQSFSADYRHQFVPAGELSAQFYHSRRGGTEESINKLLTPDPVIISGQLTSEDGPSIRNQFQLNLTRRPDSGLKYEAGYHCQSGRSEDITGYSDFDTLAGQFIEQPQFGHRINYLRDIHALFAMLSGETDRFGLQAGIRGEFTDRTIELTDSSESYNINRWDIFPTLHGSWRLSENFQVMASYSRRIDRPRGWSLEPFITWSDAYNVRTGNPALKPEYINSWEVGFQIPFRKNLISLESYYRETANVIETIRSLYSANVIMHSSENVGTSTARGLELLLNLRELSWWDINLTGNLYYYRLDATLNGTTQIRASDNWNLRMNNTFRIGVATRIQLAGRYNSSSATVQGKSAAYLATDLGVRQNLLGRQLSLILQLNDVFGAAIRESTYEGPGFYNYSRSSRNAPTVMLTVSYNFNNFREQRENTPNGNDEFNDDF